MAASCAASSLSRARRWASLPPLAPLAPIFPAAARAALKSLGVPARGGRISTLFGFGLLLFFSMRLKESSVRGRHEPALGQKEGASGLTVPSELDSCDGGCSVSHFWGVHFLSHAQRYVRSISRNGQYGQHGFCCLYLLDEEKEAQGG